MRERNIVAKYARQFNTSKIIPSKKTYTREYDMKEYDQDLVDNRIEHIRDIVNTEKVIVVVFEKKDGTERTMRCTRSLDLIPTDKHPKTEVQSSQDETSIKVFDLDISEWRSFRLESVKMITIADELEKD